MRPRTTLLRASLTAAMSIAMLASGCAGEGGECSLEVYQSVTMTVFGADGEPIEDVEVYYSVNDGPVLPAACFPDMDGFCTQWIAGEEQSGVFTIEASTNRGTLVTTTLVPDGECHVQTQHLDLIVE